ncbi:MAG: AmmeMemoRadiSam system protein B [Candidatus Hydrogenedentes bacterium]|nr:AmmeMemoRadiSam system protein B [Candidatus Hydrogenedentota bacterium]
MNTRKPAVAGQFYPLDPKTLQRMVEQYLAQSEVEPQPDRVAAVVAPHAGYIYSGPTAGFAYTRLRGKKPERIILLGTSHRYSIPGASVYSSGAFQTPLGTFPVDEPFAKALAHKIGSVSVEPHVTEHSLEVQLPFLWLTVGKVPVVPVLFGERAGERHLDVGQTLAELASETDLVVASTDLSHYLSQEQAHQIDKRTLDAILAKDAHAVISGVARGAYSMCGSAAVVAAMAYALARGATQWSLLDYRTSAETSGDYGQVVGYAAVSMEFPE